LANLLACTTAGEELNDLNAALGECLEFESDSNNLLSAHIKKGVNDELDLLRAQYDSLD
jgi:hypothetical protein